MKKWKEIFFSAKSSKAMESFSYFWAGFLIMTSVVECYAHIYPYAGGSFFLGCGMIALSLQHKRHMREMDEIHQKLDAKYKELRTSRESMGKSLKEEFCDFVREQGFEIEETKDSSKSLH